jgi:uncharacterized protein YvpB
VFLVVLLIITGGFILDNTQNSKVVLAIESVRSWINKPIAKPNTFLEDNFEMSIIKIQDQALIDAPVVNQFPELPRGCEVTSLTMLLQFAGVHVDKMTLANQIVKEGSTYRVENGKIYFGNPHDGFVGNMYTFDEPGLGVYHEPIRDLAEQYLPGQIDDLTGTDFTELKIHLSDGRPVWIITNTTYKKLSPDHFQTWYTPSGKIEVTFKEHSVLLTGYDEEFVYFNDPLTGEKNKKAPIAEFEQAWVQMGSQAITFLPQND